MRETPVPPSQIRRPRLRLDFSTVLLLTLVILLLFWMTSELWLPHWGPE